MATRDVLQEGVAERGDRVGETVGLRLSVRVAVALGLRGRVPDGVRLRVAVNEPVLESEPIGLGPVHDGVGVGVQVRLGLGMRLGLTLPLRLSAADRDRDRDGVGLRLTDTVPEPDIVALEGVGLPGDPLTLRLSRNVGLRDTERDCVALGLGLKLRVWEVGHVHERVGVGVLECCSVPHTVWLTEAVRVKVVVAVAAAMHVGLWERLRLKDRTRDGVQLLVADAERDMDVVCEGVVDALRVKEAVCVADGPGEGLTVRVAARETVVSDQDGVAVEERVEGGELLADVVAVAVGMGDTEAVRVTPWVAAHVRVAVDDAEAVGAAVGEREALGVRVPEWSALREPLGVREGGV